MEWFKNLSTRSKLFISFGLMVLLLVTLSLYAYSSITGLQKILKQAFEVELPLSLEISKLRANINRERLLTMRLIESGSDTDIKAVLQDIKENNSTVDETLMQISERARGNDDYVGLLDQFISEHKAIADARSIQIVPMMKAGKAKDARALFMGSQLEMYEKARSTILKFSELSENADKTLKERVSLKVRESLRIIVIIGVIAVVISLSLVLYLTMIIASPLKLVSDAAGKIAYGDLSVKLPVMKRADEVGTLMLSFGMMIESQKMVASEIMDATGLLAGTSKEILSRTELLTTGAMEGEGLFRTALTRISAGKTIAHEIRGAIKQADNEKMLSLIGQEETAIDEIYASMEDVKDIYNQFIVSTSQAEDTAHELNNLGQKLKKLVEQYKV